jgi:hypothetical protein
MKTSIATPSQSTSLILAVVEHRRIGRRIMGHPRSKHTQGPLTRESISTTKEAALRDGAVVVAEALIQLNLCIACTTAAKLTTAPKTAPSSWSQRKNRARFRETFAAINT